MGELPVQAETALIKARTLTRWQPPFVKRDATSNASAQIKDIVEEWTSLASRNSTSGYSPSIYKNPHSADIDIRRVVQIINNIVLKAARSMPEGCTIRISAENQEIEEHSPSGLNPGKYIKLCITDHGAGITDENSAKILNPYSAIKQKTTETVGPAYYPIIKKDDATVSVEYQQSGTEKTMTVYLPSSVKILNKEEEIKLIKCHGRILVMDNIISLKNTVKRSLKRLSHEPIDAINSSKAIHEYKKAEESGQAYNDNILDMTI